MNNNSFFTFLAGAALGAAAMWLIKTEKDQVDALLEKVEKALFTEKEKENDTTAATDGTAE